MEIFAFNGIHCERFHITLHFAETFYNASREIYIFFFWKLRLVGNLLKMHTKILSKRILTFHLPSNNSPSLETFQPRGASRVSYYQNHHASEFFGFCRPCNRSPAVHKYFANTVAEHQLRRTCNFSAAHKAPRSILRLVVSF